MSGVLVVGIGSPIMSDDAVGLKVAEEIERLSLPGVEVKRLSASGLELIEAMIDHRRAIVIDSIISGAMEPGEVAVLTPEDFSGAVEGGSPHEINLTTAIEIGRRLEPGRMPREVYFVAVEVSDVQTVSEELTPWVRSAVPRIVERVLELLGDDRS